MDFTTIKAITIPEGQVKKIERNGVVIWEEPLSYKNWVPYAIDANKNILNGVGYIGKTRLSSSGATKEATRVSTTGFIPASSGSVIRVPAEYFDGASSYVCSYNSSFGFIAAVNSGGAYSGGTVVTNGNVKEITLLSNSNIAYVRVSMEWSGEDPGYASATDATQGPCGHMIVTVNEEIA